MPSSPEKRVHGPTSPTRSTSHGTASASFFTYPVTTAVSGILRRLSDGPRPPSAPSAPSAPRRSRAPVHAHTFPAADMDRVFTPPRRTASPFQPPPLTPLALEGYKPSTPETSRLLSRALAEEIRLLLPARLQLPATWSLAFSLAQDGVSLATLYKKLERLKGSRAGYVLVVKDGEGNVFGAYLSDPPHPASSYFGTGECFLWRASILTALPTLATLPPPPSADTTHAQRMTTLSPARDLLSPESSNGASRSGTATPERIRFKAFPYSGVNDYMIFCEHDYLSVGAGDGRYGLWLDDSLEKGVSEPCLTFGNEPLSDEGTKFDVLGVEIWCMGA